MDQQQILPMQRDDVGSVMELVRREGWRGYSAQDLNLILEISPEMCYKMVDGDRMIGAIFALVLQETAILSFFLVERAYRSLSVGQSLGLTCLRAVLRRVPCITVYANRRAITSYSRYGFRPEEWVTRFEVNLESSEFLPQSENRIGVVDVSALYDLDKQCFRSDRRQLLSRWMNYEGSKVYGYRERGALRLQGSGFVRRNGETNIIGPLLAENEQIAVAILHCMLRDLPSRTATLELSRDDWTAAATKTMKFAKTSVAVRKMVLGAHPVGTDMSLLFAHGGHHF